MKSYKKKGKNYIKFTIAILLVSISAACSPIKKKEPAQIGATDFEVISAVVDDFMARYHMPAGYVIVLRTGTIFLRKNDSKHMTNNKCNNFKTFVDGLLDNNIYPSRLEPLVPTSNLWRLEKEDDEENFIERKILTFISVTRPAFLDNEKSAAVYLNWRAAHGGYGYYILRKKEDKWSVDCKDLIEPF